MKKKKEGASDEQNCNLEETSLTIDTSGDVHKDTVTV